MSFRSARERVLQTLGFEVGGLLLAAPLYAWIMGAGAGESFALVVVLSIAVMIWTPIHNTAFDWIEWRQTRRVASDRPQILRIVHAITHEVSTVVVTIPVILMMTDLGLWGALLLDLGLSAFYMAYAYVYYLIYDRLRPITVKAA